MLRLALSLLSSLQIGARFKESIDRTLRQAAIAASAVALLVIAAAFALLAAYHALITVYGFTQAQAAAILAVSLALLGVLILVVMRITARPKKSEAPSPLAAPAEGLAAIDQSLGKAMQQVNPLTLVAIAFAAGLLVSRRR